MERTHEFGGWLSWVFFLLAACTEGVNRNGDVAGAAVRALTTVAEVVVGFVEPVFAGGIEDVEVDGIFDGPGFVGQVRRDAEDFAGADDDFAANNGKFQGAFEDV